MEPRLKTSKKWTSFPDEYLKQVQKVFNKSFQLHLENGKILAEGRIYQEELLLKVGFLENNRLKQSNFEISVQYDKKKENAVQLIYILIDVAATMMDEFFMAESDHDFPRFWQEYDVENKKVYLQYTSTNDNLENQANALLGLDDDRLVKDDDSEIIEVVKSQLGVDDQDPDDTTEH
jgi:hypothetical protein